MTIKRIAVCSGEPAGVGIELCLRLAKHQCLFDNTALIILADEALLKQRIQQLNLSISIISIDQAILRDTKKLQKFTAQAKENKQLLVFPVSLNFPSISGQLNTQNVPYVLNILALAHQLCADGDADGILTLPIHKGIINEYLQLANKNDVFYGHTEYLQQKNHCDEVVMMLSCEKLSVALATTHIPIQQVAQSICAQRLEKKLTIIHQYYRLQTNTAPKIAVLALNPHAGENGYIGQEEIEIIQPVIEKLRQKGLNLSNAMSADTAFIESNLSHFDCFFGMYHDQVSTRDKASRFSSNHQYYAWLTLSSCLC